MSESQTILVVEDESAIRSMLSFTLQTAGYDVLEAANAEQAWQLLLSNEVACILLDWMLPGVSGVELAQRIRGSGAQRSVPIILLTARGEESDQVEGFEAGADDYVVKPFSPKALLARLKALLRRVNQDVCTQDLVRFNDFELDVSSHRFRVGEHELHLGPTEFRLMQFFMLHPDRVYSRMQLLDHVWGETVVVEERTVDVHIRRLRKQLEPLGVADYIQTVRGAGYRFAKPVLESD